MADAAPLLTVLDPDGAVRAGRVFGQIAVRADGGALIVAAARAIEQNHRATVLIIPDLFRIDLEPQGDALRVHLRALTEHACTWTSTPETIDALDRGNPLEPQVFDVRIELPEGAIVGAAKLMVVGDDDLHAIYVSARATVRPAEPVEA